jgi:hypothetical protein
MDLSIPSSPVADLHATLVLREVSVLAPCEGLEILALIKKEKDIHIDHSIL